MLTKYMVRLSATMEQTHEIQLAQLYNILGFRRVIALYDVVSTLQETGPRCVDDVCVGRECHGSVTRVSRECHKSVMRVSQDVVWETVA